MTYIVSSGTLNPTIPYPDLRPFDLETGMQVTSKVGNFHSEFGHTRPSGSGIICYVRDGQMDRRTDRQTKATLRRGIIITL